MTDLSLRQAIISEAETWLDTPFHHEARLKNVGVDCGQLLIAVYSTCGFVPQDFKIDHYSPDFALHRDREWYLELVESFGYQVSVPLPGDAVLFKWGRIFSHGGIVVEWPNIIHAWAICEKVLRFDATRNPLAEKERRFYSPFKADSL